MFVPFALICLLSVFDFILLFLTFLSFHAMVAFFSY